MENNGPPTGDKKYEPTIWEKAEDKAEMQNTPAPSVTETKSAFSIKSLIPGID